MSLKEEGSVKSSIVSIDSPLCSCTYSELTELPFLCGAIIRVKGNESIYSSETLQKEIAVCSPEILENWMKYPVDTEEMIQHSLEKCLEYSSKRISLGQTSSSFGGITDVDWWCQGDSVEARIVPKSLTRLRRLLLPLSVLSHGDESKTQVETMRYSLIDVLLSSEATSRTIFNLLHSYLDLLETKETKTLNTAVFLSLRRRIKAALRPVEKSHYLTLAPTSPVSIAAVLETRQSSRLHSSSPSASKRQRRDDNSDKLVSLVASIVRRDAAGCSNNDLLQLDARRAREEMIHRWLFPDRYPIEKPTLCEGSVVVSVGEMSEKEFLHEAEIMDLANEGLPRPFYPHSRPRLAKSKLDFIHLDRLRRLFFDDDGSLLERVCKDVEFSDKHNYILFSNDAGDGTGDRRWQIPIRSHTRGNVVETRRRVEEILEEAGQIDTAFESIVEIGLLIGGTMTQALHHDHGREFTELHRVENDESALAGWETQRLEYNMEMSGTHAPTGQIYGMSTSKLVQIGVQKDCVTRLDAGVCGIIHGVPGETFRVDRHEGEHVVVVEAPGGVVFTGDMPHAGVRNVRLDGPEYTSMIELFENIDGFLMEEGEGGNKHALGSLCHRTKVNDFSRLYLSTELKKSRINIPRNAIGYHECK